MIGDCRIGYDSVSVSHDILFILPSLFKAICSAARPESGTNVKVGTRPNGLALVDISTFALHLPRRLAAY